jgi:sugar phosphate isomerase/epimerase
MKLSLAGWSLHRLFRAAERPLLLVDFPRFTRETFGIDAVELNSPFFESREPQYLRKLADAARGAGVKLLNIAVDEAGDLASELESARLDGINNYARWIPVAKEIGCAAIRANSGGKQVTDRAIAVANCVESFHRLIDEGQRHGVAVLIENHGGISADADTIVHLMNELAKAHPPESFGTMPDFGNWPEDVDRYESLRKIMPFAKAVHAKVRDIDEQLNHPQFDHARCIKIAREAGYDGYLGIEYEGAGEPIEGIKRAVRKLTPLLRT